jgi:hypothetical protein
MPPLRTPLVFRKLWEQTPMLKLEEIVNYDLPWNPNRMEQRFGRIHRIGQREVATCGIW